MARTRSRTDWLVVHAAATPPSMDIGFEEIDQWHKKNGWTGCGYHFIIRRDGLMEHGREMYTVGAHVQGSNWNSIGICMVGGVDEATGNNPDDNFTTEQRGTLRALLNQLTKLFPDAKVRGHRDFPNVFKACPCFDVTSWLED